MKKFYLFAIVLILAFLFLYFGNFNFTGDVIRDFSGDLREVNEPEEENEGEGNESNNREESFFHRVRDRILRGSSGRESEEKGLEEKYEEKKVNLFRLDISPTREWVDFYGKINFNEEPAPVGSEVAVVDSNKNIIGFYKIKNEGEYGFLHAYLDNEGKNSESIGEEVSFIFHDGFGNEYELEEEYIISDERVVNINLNGPKFVTSLSQQ